MYIAAGESRSTLWAARALTNCTIFELAPLRVAERSTKLDLCIVCIYRCCGAGRGGWEDLGLFTFVRLFVEGICFCSAKVWIESREGF